ncbi:MAG: response regulator [Phreatobacter sp.]|uniref:response regulator n=1 Tax=Phreatobacter sp. TaxID=1966341 RepID=UPI002736C5BB|nr:response regulator [Phreatobacter sp.]MDP2800906.1 response regulator [Phreatobacter sp.]
MIPDGKSAPAEASDIVFVDGSWAILIAEDNPGCRARLEVALAGYSYPIEVRIVSRGEDLLRELATNAYDLAFVDIALGTSSGLDAVRAAREQGMGTFVVVVSGSRTALDRSEARALGAYDFIGKPVATLDVHRALDAFQKVRARSSALLIDDSGTARRLMRRIFDRSIFRVDVAEAADGVEGIELFARAPTDFVFIDLHMGGLDGLATARVIRAISPDTKIVIISADVSRIVDDRRFSSLKKPFDARQLDAMLHDLNGLPHPALL